MNIYAYWLWIGLTMGLNIPPRVVIQTDSVHILMEKEFEQISLVDSISKPLINALSVLMYDSDKRIANPAEKFNPTDIIDEALPLRRLIFAGKSKKYWFIYYEKGGFTHNYPLVLFRIEHKNIIPILGLVFLYKANNLEELKILISKEKPRQYDLKEYHGVF